MHVSAKFESPALVTVNFKVAMVPLPLKPVAGLSEVTTRWKSPIAWEAESKTTDVGLFNTPLETPM